MSKKSICKVVILTALVLMFWFFEIFVLTQLITNNKPTQLIIDMATLPILLIITINGVIRIWKGDKA